MFGGHHVVLIRDPVQQWLSARSQRLQHRSPYFELGYLMILALASRLSVAGRIARWLKIPQLRNFRDCSMPAHHRLNAQLNVHAIQREVAERILMEQAELAPELVPHDAETGEDHEGPTATGAPRRA